MRNFIVSDLHGNGYLYDSIINYLDNELTYGNDDISLYINGDLIDRGPDSGSMLVDVKKRIENNISFPIFYLGGNHELMMYKSYSETKKYESMFLSENVSKIVQNWKLGNSGDVTAGYLKKYYTREEIDNICEFVGNLDIYHIFDEKINDKNILLVHAFASMGIEEKKKLKINDSNPDTFLAVWTRPYDLPGYLQGSLDYFTIVGHTPVRHYPGFEYSKNINQLNIDGNSATFGYYLSKIYKSKETNKPIEDIYIPLSDIDLSKLKDLDEVSHFPLVEIMDDKIKILIFNYKNEIIDGNYLIDNEIKEMDNNELNKIRNNLKENPKTLKRINLSKKTF